MVGLLGTWEGEVEGWGDKLRLGYEGKGDGLQR